MSTIRDFIKDIGVFEKKFKGKWSTGMLAEYCCWSLKQDKPEQEHKRRRRFDFERLFSFCIWCDFLLELLCCFIFILDNAETRNKWENKKNI